jgi:hypothetical protein
MRIDSQLDNLDDVLVPSVRAWIAKLTLIRGNSPRNVRASLERLAKCCASKPQSHAHVLPGQSETMELGIRDSKVFTAVRQLAVPPPKDAICGARGALDRPRILTIEWQLGKFLDLSISQKPGCRSYKASKRTR